MPTWYLAGTERYRGPVLPAVVIGGGTTLDLTQTGSGVGLSPDHLTGTTSNTTNAFTGTLFLHQTGQYYFELSFGQVSGISTGFFMSASGGTYPTNYIVMTSTGVVEVPAGSSAGVGVTYTAGTVIGVAIDFSVPTIKFQTLSSGGFSTPVVFTSALNGANFQVGALLGAATGDNATFNFGATSYVMTPSGGSANW